MGRLGLVLGILGVAAAAAACGSSGAGTVPSQPASPKSSAAVDRMRIDMMRLRLDDLGPNWRTDKPSDTPGKCNPRPKDVTITAGSWKSKGVNFANGISTEIHSDAIVFTTPADAQKTVEASTAPSVSACLKHEFEKALRHGDVKLRSASTSILHRKRVADEFAGFRLTLNLEKGDRYYRYYFDTCLHPAGPGGRSACVRQPLRARPEQHRAHARERHRAARRAGSVNTAREPRVPPRAPLLREGGGAHSADAFSLRS